MPWAVTAVAAVAEAAALPGVVLALDSAPRGVVLAAGLWLWLGKFVCTAEVVTRCPTGYYRSSGVVWDCAGESFSSLVQLQPYQSGLSIVEVPRGVTGLQAKMTVDDELELQVYDKYSDTDVVKSIGGVINDREPSGTYQKLDIQVQKNKLDGGAFGTYVEDITFSGTLLNPLTLRCSSASQRTTAATVLWKYESITPCPDEPIGCKIYNQDAAFEEAAQWSCWANLEIRSLNGAWNKFAELQSDAVAGVPWFRWGSVWSFWPGRASNESWKYAFHYLDKDQDMHINWFEFKRGYKLCNGRKTVPTDWQEAWSGNYWDSEPGDSRVASRTHGSKVSGTITFVWDGRGRSGGRRLGPAWHGTGSYEGNCVNAHFSFGQRWSGVLIKDGSAIQWMPLDERSGNMSCQQLQSGMPPSSTQAGSNGGQPIIWPRAPSNTMMGTDAGWGPGWKPSNAMMGSGWMTSPYFGLPWWLLPLLAALLAVLLLALCCLLPLCFPWLIPWLKQLFSKGSQGKQRYRGVTMEDPENSALRSSHRHIRDHPYHKTRGIRSPASADEAQSLLLGDDADLYDPESMLPMSTRAARMPGQSQTTHGLNSEGAVMSVVMVPTATAVVPAESVGVGRSTNMSEYISLHGHSIAQQQLINYSRQLQPNHNPIAAQVLPNYSPDVRNTSQLAQLQQPAPATAVLASEAYSSSGAYLRNLSSSQIQQQQQHYQQHHFFAQQQQQQQWQQQQQLQQLIAQPQQTELVPTVNASNARAVDRVQTGVMPTSQLRTPPARSRASPSPVRVDVSPVASPVRVRFSESFESHEPTGPTTVTVAMPAENPEPAGLMAVTVATPSVNLQDKSGWTEEDWEKWASLMATADAGFSASQWKRIGGMRS